MAFQTPIGLTEEEFIKEYSNFLVTTQAIKNSGRFSEEEQYKIKMLALGIDVNTDITADEIANLFYEGLQNGQKYDEILTQLPTSLKLIKHDTKMELTNAWRSEPKMFSDTVTRKPNPKMEPKPEVVTEMIDLGINVASYKNEIVGDFFGQIGIIKSAANVVDAIRRPYTDPKYPLSDNTGILGFDLDAMSSFLSELSQKTDEEKFENIADKSTEDYTKWASYLSGYTMQGYIWNNCSLEQVILDYSNLMKTSAQDMIFARLEEMREGINNLWGKNSIEATTLISMYESIYRGKYLKAQAAGQILDNVISSRLSDGEFSDYDATAIIRAAGLLDNVLVKSVDERKRYHANNDLNSMTSLSNENVESTITDMKYNDFLDLDQMVNSATNNVYKACERSGIRGMTDITDVAGEAKGIIGGLNDNIINGSLEHMGAITRFCTLILSEYHPEIDAYSKKMNKEYYKEKEQFKLPPGYGHREFEEHMNTFFLCTKDLQRRKYPNEDEVFDINDDFLMTYLFTYPDDLLVQFRDYYLHQNRPIPTAITETEALRDRVRGILTTNGYMDYGDWDGYLHKAELGFGEEKSLDQRILDAQHLPTLIYDSVFSEFGGWDSKIENPNGRSYFTKLYGDLFDFPKSELVYTITQNQPYTVDDIFDRRKKGLDPNTKDMYDNDHKYFITSLPYVIKGLPYYAQGGRTTEAGIFGEAGPEWAIPERHDARTAELLNSARENSGFSWTELIASTGGLNGGGNLISNNITYAPVVHANDARGVEDVLSKDKQMLDDWWKHKQWETARTHWA